MIIKHTIPITVGSLGDFETEHWTAEDWVQHKEHIRSLEASGELGKEYDVTIKVESNHLLDDDANVPKHASSSHKFIALDLTKTKGNE